MMTGLMKKWISVILCISMTVPVYAAQTDDMLMPENEIIQEDNSVISGADDESPVEEVIDEAGIVDDSVDDSIIDDSIDTLDELPEEIPNDGIGSIPSKFDPRDEDPWYITPVRDQGNHGSCWAHGILFAAEANLLKNRILPQYNENTLNLSERVLNHIACNQDKYPNDYDPLHNSVGEYDKNAMSYDRPSYYDNGGTSFFSGAVLQRWLGVVNELDTDGTINPDTYYGNIPKSGIDDIDVKYISPVSGNVVAHAENIIYLDKDKRDAIKKYIVKDGALDCSYYADDYMGSDKVSYYCYEDKDANHEVAVVGWDDNYDRRKFNSNKDEIPKYNGAWLIRNSWNNDYGDRGYFWLSYEDKSFVDITAVEMAPADNYDNNYYYAGTSGRRINFDNDIRIASVFNVKGEGGEKQVLRAVSLALNSYDTEYEVKIYNGSDGDFSGNPIPAGADAVSSASGYLEYPGVHTIKLNTPVAINAGEAFSVVMHLTQEYGRKITLFTEVADKYTVVNQHPGEAYLDQGGSGFEDVSDPVVNGENAINFRLNAYTDRVEDDFDIVGIENQHPDGPAWDSVTRTVTVPFTSDTTTNEEEIAPKSNFTLSYNGVTGSGEVTLSSNNIKIAKIGSDGKTITATGAGRTYITAQYSYDDGTTVKRRIAVVVKKEIKKGWFVYKRDNEQYKPGDNEIALYETSKYETDGGDWAEYKDANKDNYTRLSADAYDLEYAGNDKVTADAKATIKTPQSTFSADSSNCFYYADAKTITYKIEKYTGPFNIFFKDGEWNKDENRYEYEYTGGDIFPEIDYVAYPDGTEIDYTVDGYDRYDPTDHKFKSTTMHRDAGLYRVRLALSTALYNPYIISQEFVILNKDITDSIVEYNREFTYTGTDIKPPMIVYGKDWMVIPKGEYEVEYHNNRKVYDISAQGIGDDAPYFLVSAKDGMNFKNWVTADKKDALYDPAHPDRFYFSILPRDLEAATKSGAKRTKITLTQSEGRKSNDYAYTGEEVKPVISKVQYVVDKGQNPVNLGPDDYEVSYENNVYPSDKNKAKVIITGKGNYMGSASTEFTITDDSQATVSENIAVTLKNSKKTSYVYTGKVIKPDIVVKLVKADGTVVRKLKKNEYKVHYYNVEYAADTGAIDAGKWGIAVTPADPAKVNFKTNNRTRFTINPKSAGKLKITLSSNRITQGNKTDDDYIAYLAGGVTPGVKSVKDGRNVVDADSYSVSFRNNTSCGIATAVFSFAGNYTGTKEVPYTIAGKKISKLKFTKIKDQTVELDSDGNPMDIYPEPGDDFHIYDSKNNEVINKKGETDKYDIYYHNNWDVGKAEVVVKGCGIYEGTAVIPFKIVKRKISAKSVKAGNDDTGNDLKDVYLTGTTAIPAKISVVDTKSYWDSKEEKYQSRTLKENEDYTIKISNNKKPGTGKVTVIGRGYYEGKTVRTFDIVDDRRIDGNKCDIGKLVDEGKLIITSGSLNISSRLSNNSISEKLSCCYCGDPITFDDLVFTDFSQVNEDRKGYTMQEGYDYTIKYRNNTNASADPEGNHINRRKTPELVISGKGPNYKGTYSIPFEIKQIRLSTATIKPLWDPRVPFAPTGYAPDVNYNGKARKPVPYIYYLDEGYENSVYASKLLVKLNNKVFSIKYTNNKKISEEGARFILKPKKLSNFSVAKDQPVKLEYKYGIVKGDLSEASIAAVSAQTYKGLKVTPRPAVKLNGTRLKEGRDFVFEYADNEACGIGHLSIKPVDGDSCYELKGEAPKKYFIIK